MKRYVAIILGIFLFIIGNSCAFSQSQPIIKVGIALHTPHISVSSSGGLLVTEGGKILFSNKTSSSLTFKVENGMLSFFSHYARRVRISSYKGYIKVGKRNYRGYIEIYPFKNFLNVINVLPLEEYLKGVIRMEISEKWPINAIMAQAIIARTFALYNWNKHIKEGFNLCATTHCQLYGGVTHESTITNEVVEKTKGLIIVYKGKPIDSVYHSASGGYTESSEYVWGRYIPYLRAVKSDFEKPQKNIEWTFTITGDMLRKKIYSWYRKDIGEIYDIKIDKLSPHKRIFMLSVIGKKGKIKIKGTNFRFLLGTRNLKSTLFTINKLEEKRKVIVLEKVNEKVSLIDKFQQKEDWTLDELIDLLKEDLNDTDDKNIKIIKKELEVNDGETIFIFKGRGLGHGVGLSQWGAKALAERGYNYKDILNYYYQDTEVVRFYK